MDQKMRHTEGTFKGYKGFGIYYQCWLPEGNPRAILMVCPGMAEHSGRYMNLVNYFVPRGYAICGLDHRGHGKSEGMRCYIDRFSDYLVDLKIFFDIIRAGHPGTKIFLVGHSMGAMAALDYAIHYQNDLAGLVLSGVGLMAGSSFTRIQKIAAQILSRLFPTMGVGVLDATAISQDKAVVNAYVNDPLVYRGKIPARLGAELLKVIQKLPSQLPTITLPVLIMHASEDRLCDPEGSRLLYEKVGSKDKTLKFYEGFHHEIFNEPGRNQVLADTADWLEAHL